LSTDTQNQIIEYWPKYEIHANPDDDYQRAYISFNDKGVDVGYNIRAEYCSFWGHFIPQLIIRECKYF
jgi:hypothetical protein